MHFTGDVQPPDRLQGAMTTSTNNDEVETQVVVIGDTSYVKNPLTDRWVVNPQSVLFNPENLMISASDVKELKFLGEETVRRFGPRLPFLFKVLDVRDMASIQAHPTKAQAEAGFAKENAQGIPLDAPQRSYRDENHKPEAHVALSDFWLLHGWRSLVGESAFGLRFLSLLAGVLLVPVAGVNSEADPSYQIMLQYTF